MTDQVKRFSMTWKLDDDDFVFVQPIEDQKGRWVSHEDYTRIKSEVDALKLGSLLTAVDVLQFINLKAENERLRKAGDAVSLCLEAFWKGKPYDTSTNIECFDAWSAAKENKPSV